MNTVTIVAATMNRNERASGAIANWLQFEEISKIVIVDWSSSPPLQIDKSDRVHLVRVEGERHFVLTQAVNLAASFVTSGTILKMDVDYRITDKSFIGGLDLAPREFFRGDNSMMGPHDNERHLNGCFALLAEDFHEIGGFNERIYGYGIDETDLYNRLISSGFKYREIRESMGIYHLPHPRKLRTANMPHNDYAAMIDRNRAIANESKWSKESERISWVCDGSAWRRKIKWEWDEK